MSPRDRRNLLLLCIAVATLIAVLPGCATTRYEWFQAATPSQSYKWVVVQRDTFAMLCGFHPSTAWNAGGACVVRDGTSCTVYATMSEDEARRMMDKYGEHSLRDHEVIEHCQRGLNHYEVTR